MLCRVCKGQLRHDGTMYAVGDEVELDEETSSHLAADGIVEPVRAKPAPKAKAKKAAKS